MSHCGFFAGKPFTYSDAQHGEAEVRSLMEEAVQVEGRYQVQVRDDRGRLPSPWGDGTFEKGDVELNDTQTGVLHVAFRVADDEGLLLLDLADLRALLTHCAANAKAISATATKTVHAMA